MNDDRVWLLIQQGRWEMARDELQLLLGVEPDHAGAHSMLALCHSHLDDHRQAIEEAERGIAGAPDVPFAHYAHGIALAGANQAVDAERSVDTAIELDPDNPVYRTFKGRLRLHHREWKQALSCAEEALALDPEHVDAINLRAYALTKLGRPVEAGAAAEAALLQDPNDHRAHANKGWTLLEQGKHVEAMEHFREALRIQPNDEWARDGIMNALRSRHLIYRVMLRYFLWMSRLKSGAQWGIIVAGYVGFRVIRTVQDRNPELAPYLTPLVVAYFVFVYLSWTADALFNLLLRLHPFGRLVLDKDEIRASNIVGLLLLGALACGVALLFVQNTVLVIAALTLATLPIPVAATFSVVGKQRFALGFSTTCLALIALGAGGAAVVDAELGGAALVMYFVGFLGFSFFANYLFTRR